MYTLGSVQKTTKKEWIFSQHPEIKQLLYILYLIFLPIFAKCTVIVFRSKNKNVIQ